MSGTSATSTRWLDILSRATAAIGGGYLFSYMFTAAVAILLSLAKADAVIVATLLSFVVYTLVVLWAFACRRAWHAWLPVVAALPLGLIGFWPRLMGWGV